MNINKFMDNKFKVGDLIVRTGCTNDFVTKGEVYTVERCVNNTVYLEECPWGYDSHNFELVEQKEKEMTFKNMKFDVAAVAKQLNVEHEEASRIIQEALFEQGYSWAWGEDFVIEQSHPYLYAYTDNIIYGGNSQRFKEHSNKLHTIKTTYAIVEAEEQQEIVELNGKKYNKQELEKALSLLKPIE